MLLGCRKFNMSFFVLVDMMLRSAPLANSPVVYKKRKRGERGTQRLRRFCPADTLSLRSANGISNWREGRLAETRASTRVPCGAACPISRRLRIHSNVLWYFSRP